MDFRFATSPKRATASARSWKKSPTKNACAPRSVTCRSRSSNAIGTLNPIGSRNEEASHWGCPADPLQGATDSAIRSARAARAKMQFKLELMVLAHGRIYGQRQGCLDLPQRPSGRTCASPPRQHPALRLRADAHQDPHATEFQLSFPGKRQRSTPSVDSPTPADYLPPKAETDHRDGGSPNCLTVSMLGELVSH